MLKNNETRHRNDVDLELFTAYRSLTGPDEARLGTWSEPHVVTSLLLPTTFNITAAVKVLVSQHMNAHRLPPS